MNEQPTFNISLNKNEIEVLLNLLDVAVKSAGRSACEAVHHFERKLNTALETPSAAAVAVPVPVKE